MRCDQIRDRLAAVFPRMLFYFGVGLERHGRFGVAHVGLYHRQRHAGCDFQRGKCAAKFPAVCAIQVDRAADLVHIRVVQLQWKGRIAIFRKNVASSPLMLDEQIMQFLADGDISVALRGLWLFDQNAVVINRCALDVDSIVCRVDIFPHR